MFSGCSWTTLSPSGPATRLGQNVQSSQLLPNEEQYEPAHSVAPGTSLQESTSSHGETQKSGLQ